jgi:hypothetical protein
VCGRFTYRLSSRGCGLYSIGRMQVNSAKAPADELMLIDRLRERRATI